MPRKPLIDQLHREDSWRLFRILAEFVEGFEALAEIDMPLVSVFGSARFGGPPRLRPGLPPRIPRKRWSAALKAVS